MVVLALFGVIVGSCSGPPSPQTDLPAMSTVWQPTSVPGSVEDVRAAIGVLEQFKEGLQQNNDVVTLLLLTPSAQRRVATRDLREFATPQWWRNSFVDCRSEVIENSAHVTCVWRTSPIRSEVTAVLLRLNDQWKIDRIDVRDQP